MKIELFKYTSVNVRHWIAEADYINECIHINHGVLDGVMQYQRDDIRTNNSGRSVEDQIDLEMNQRAKLKRDIGYRETVEQSKIACGQNTLGFHRPMLAKRADQLNDIDYKDCYLQMKYDGHRCMVTRTSTGLVAFSRGGNVIDTISHILSGIDMPVGMTIDGELYCHGVPLQEISSWARRKQPNTLNLEYIIYDVVSKDPYDVRFNVINNISTNKYAKVAPTDKEVKPEHMPALLSTAIAMGYEGLMLRQCRFPYEPGKRSKALVKVKSFIDDEFLVLGVEPSKEGWAVLVCESSNGKVFNVSAPGTMDQKKEILRNKGAYIGRHVTIKYASSTNDGIPFHPVAVAFREDI